MSPPASSSPARSFSGITRGLLTRGGILQGLAVDFAFEDEVWVEAEAEEEF